MKNKSCKRFCDHLEVSNSNRSECTRTKSFAYGKSSVPHDMMMTDILKGGLHIEVHGSCVELHCPYVEIHCPYTCSIGTIQLDVHVCRHHVYMSLLLMKFYFWFKLSFSDGKYLFS